MASMKHVMRVDSHRKVNHPVVQSVAKHYFLVRASELPRDIRTDANARNPGRLNRRVYRDVADSLMGRDEPGGSFDLMNKGIVCLANSVKRIHQDGDEYEFEILDGQGIVDGGHTYQIICDAQGSPDLPPDQYVDVQIRTGVPVSLITGISKGLNTGIQVKEHSLANLDHKFDWIKDELKGESYFELISWKESEQADYDVRDLVCIMEALNVVDYPNGCGSHPVQAYEKWSGPTKKFTDDPQKYEKFRPLLKDALALYDTIRREFHNIYNEAELGHAGALDIVEKPRGKNKLFEFPFSGADPASSRLTKGALYPIFAAFRNVVRIDDDSGCAYWEGGFSSVLELWQSVGVELVRATKDSLKALGHKPDVIGKNRGHWKLMHQTLELHQQRHELLQLRAQLLNSQSKAS